MTSKFVCTHQDFILFKKQITQKFCEFYNMNMCINCKNCFVKPFIRNVKNFKFFS